jgi:hypothetical protein
MPKLTVAQISDLRALRDHCVALGADLVVIGAIRFDSGVNAFVFGLWKNWVYWVCIGWPTIPPSPICHARVVAENFRVCTRTRARHDRRYS